MDARVGASRRRPAGTAPRHTTDVSFKVRLLCKQHRTAFNDGGWSVEDYMSRGAVRPQCLGTDGTCVMAGRAALRVVGTLISRPGAVQLRGYAKKPVAKGKGKGFVKEVQKGPEVCKDPALLTTHAMGVNIYKSGSDVKLKDDSQYPEWLFQLYLEPPKPLEERSPDTPQYWKLLRKLHMWRNNRLAKAKKF